NGGGMRAIGILITPTSTGYLDRIEVVLHHQRGGHNLTGYLMTDASGPGKVLAKVSFSVPDFVAFGTDEFTRWRVQPGTYGAMLRLYGEASATADKPPQPEPTPPAAPLPVAPSPSATQSSAAVQSPGAAQSFPGSLVNQKLILRHAPAVVEMKLKTSQLSSLAGECDVAVQVREAKWSHGKLSLLLDTIGEPSPVHCKQT